jgi:hypothetical protein
MLRFFPRAARPVLAAAVALGAACTEPTGPAERLAGTYAMTTYNGQPLPAAATPGSYYRVIAATLTLSADGTYARQFVDGDTDGGGPYPGGIYTGTWTFDRRSATLVLMPGYGRSPAPETVDVRAWGAVLAERTSLGGEDRYVRRR